VWEKEEGAFLTQTLRKDRNVEEERNFLAQTLRKVVEEKE
jgi:hypothetical protein